MQESWDQLATKDVTYDSYRHLLSFVLEIQADLAVGKKSVFVMLLLQMVVKWN